MINVIVSTIIWGLAIALFASILVTGGLPLGKKAEKKLAFLDKSTLYRKEQYHPEQKDYIGVFWFSIAIRIGMLLFAVVAICLFMDQQTLKWNDFWNRFVIWDANSYINIAKGGYTQYLENNEPITLVFFPLYSVLIRGFHLINANADYRVIAVFVSMVCYAIGNCFFYGFTAKQFGKNVAKTAVFLLMISPFGFFFGTIMSESVFFMMIAICLYLLQQRKWWLFGVAGILCALARMQGVLIIIPACICWFESCRPIEKLRKKEWKAFWKDCYTKGITLFLPILGTLSYLLINKKVAGDAFAFTGYQRKYWYHGYMYIGKAVKNHLSHCFTNGISMTTFSMFIPQMLFFILAIVLCYYAFNKMDNMLVCYLLAFTVVSYSLDWLISGSRYMLTALPMWIILALICEKHEWIKKVIYVLSPALMGVYYVGYLFMKQIM